MVNDNYLKLICEDISLDQDLEFFFKRLSENYEDIVTMAIKNNYELIPEPNIDEIKIKLVTIKCVIVISFVSNA